MNRLEELSKRGVIEIVKTDVVDTELQGHYNPGSEKSQKYGEDLGVGVWGQSRWDHCVYGDADDDRRLAELLSTIFGTRDRRTYSSQEVRDAMALQTHIRHKRDYFITRDEEILSKKDILSQQFSVIVCTPDDCFEYLREKGIIREEPQVRPL